MLLYFCDYILKSTVFLLLLHKVYFIVYNSMRYTQALFNFEFNLFNTELYSPPWLFNKAIQDKIYKR